MRRRRAVQRAPPAPTPTPPDRVSKRSGGGRDSDVQLGLGASQGVRQEARDIESQRGTTAVPEISNREAKAPGAPLLLTPFIPCPSYALLNHNPSISPLALSKRGDFPAGINRSHIQCTGC